MEDSDDDYCQLYTGTAEKFTKMCKEAEAKRKELDNVFSSVSEDEYDIVLKEVNYEKCTENSGSILKKDTLQETSTCNQSQIILTNTTESDDDDDIPLAELCERLRSRRKRKVTSSQHKKRKRNPRRCKNQPNTSSMRDLGIIVLDDDSGYQMDSLPPIDFNSRVKKKKSEENVIDLSLNDTLSNCSEEQDDFYESDSLVTLTVEFHDGMKSTRKEFKLRKYQKFESVFQELASMSQIPTNRIVLMYNYKSLNPSDTPSSLGLTFYGALIGSVSAFEVNHEKIQESSESEKSTGSKDQIHLKLLLESKKTLMYKVKQHQRMKVLYEMCAEDLKCEVSQLKINIDGEHIEPNELISSLDLEDGDVLHVYIKS